MPNDTAHDDIDVLGDVLGGHVDGSDGYVEGLVIFGPDSDRLAEAVDHRRGISSGCDGLRHLSARTENGTEPLTDLGHQRGLGDEVVGLVRNLLCLLLVVSEGPNLVGADHKVSNVFGFKR